jgi:Phage integrase family
MKYLLTYLSSNDECKADISKVKSPIAGLRFHDLRHHAITELAESTASDQTIKSIAGHISQKMLEHYSHIRLAVKRTAVDALSSGESDGSYGTKDDTNEQVDERSQPQVAEKMVDVAGIEPATPCLQSKGRKTLSCFVGVAYTGSQRNSRSPNVPKLYRVIANQKFLAQP